jgi:hypothetical protein
MLKTAKDFIVETRKTTGGIFTRIIWSRKGSKQLSIPRKLRDRHHIQIEDHVSVCINWEGKIYLSCDAVWNTPKDKLAQQIGHHLRVPTTVHANRTTLYFTIPGRMYLSNALDDGQPVIMMSEGDALIRIIPIHEE